MRGPETFVHTYMYIPEEKPEKTEKPENGIKGHVVVPESFVHTYMYMYIHIYTYIYIYISYIHMHVCV